MRAAGAKTVTTNFYNLHEIMSHELSDDMGYLAWSKAGVNPYDRDLSDLIGELSTRSETFRTRWAAHNVRFHRTGVKRVHHPEVGDPLRQSWRLQAS